MAQGVGVRPWKRGTESARALLNSVLPSGDIIVTDDGNIYAGDGVTQTSALRRLVRMNETAEQTIDGKTTFTSLGGLRSTTFFGLGAGVGSRRNPHYENLILDGSTIDHTIAAPGGDDYVGVQLNLTIQGGFDTLSLKRTGAMTAGQNVLTLSAGTFASPIAAGWTVVVPGAGAGGGTLKAQISAINSTTTATLTVTAGTTVSGAACRCSSAADDNFVFGANDFFRTGALTGAVAGIDNIFGRLMEMHHYTPNSVVDTIKATSSEVAIEASAAGSTLKRAIGHHVKAVANKSNATIEKAYGLYVEGTPTANAAESWAMFVEAGKSSIGGPLLVKGASPSDIALTLRTPLNPTATAMELRDATGTNRFMYIGTGGSVSSVQGFTAYEGLGSQVFMGFQPGGFAGLAFGSGTPDVRWAKAATGVMRYVAGLASAVPNVATTGRAAAAVAAAGAMYWDTTLAKLMVSDGTGWYPITVGAAA